MNKRQRKKWVKKHLLPHFDQRIIPGAGYGAVVLNMEFASGVIPQPDVIGYEYPTGTPVFAEPRHNDDIPDDTALPLEEWNRRVDALLAECAVRREEQS